MELAPMTDDVERLRIHATYSRRIGRHTLADAIDRAADALAAEPIPAKDRPLLLLQEWFAWWYDDEDAPAKLPEALQVRTAVTLAQHGMDPLPR